MVGELTAVVDVGTADTMVEIAQVGHDCVTIVVLASVAVETCTVVATTAVVAWHVGQADVTTVTLETTGAGATAGAGATETTGTTTVEDGQDGQACATTVVLEMVCVTDAP